MSVPGAPVDTEWEPPRPGHWRRDFRMGEWLPAPVTPSFETWFLPRFEQGFSDASEEVYSVRMVLPLHVLVNGWYFTNEGKMEGLVRGVAKHPVYLLRWSLAMATIATRPERGERVMAEPSRRLHDERLLPAYQDLVRRSEAAVDAAPMGEVGDLVGVVDALAYQSGTLMLPLVETLGFAGKAEFALATFYDRHLRPVLGGTHQPLLVGLVPARPPRPHAVHSIDWIEPTAGELGTTSAEPDPGLADALTADRRAAEAACRAALAERPKLLARFDEVLAIAQRWIPVREEMADTFTLAWPTLREATLRIGSQLVELSCIDRPDDVFFLERDEIEAALAGARTALGAQVAERRARRESQRTLSPPLAIGKPSGPFRQMAAVSERYRAAPAPVADTDPDHHPRAGADRVSVLGLPTAPGIASGPARIVRDLDDFDKVQPGDVLVAPVTAPAWTPLFTLAAAVVTDGGSVFAHASVVAREYGIPAVVAAEHATSSFRDGDIVTVDGETGMVSVTG